MDGLVTDGLVRREARAGDRRRVDYRLTPRGRAAFKEANKVALAALDEMSQVIPAPGRKRALGGLDEWTRAIEARRAEWGPG